MDAGVARFRVDQFDRSTFVVTDSVLNMEFCICSDDAEQSKGMQAEIKAKFIADALNSRWKQDQEIVSRTWKNCIKL